MEYALEIGKIVEKIKKHRIRSVCIQLPDGLKPLADRIEEEITSKTGARVFIWAGSCFGACDIPSGIERLGIDLLVQFGHSEWR